MNKAFIFLVMFYTAFFAMAGLVPAEGITIGSDDIDYSNQTGTSATTTGTGDNQTTVYTPNPIYEDYSWTTPFTTFLDNLFVNITGLPTMIIALVFSPLAIIGGYWLIMFIKGFIPFLN